MRWNSPVPPRVSRLRACVSPRVKRALPCTRGITPTSQVMGRTSSVARPSGRRFSTAMRRRMMSFSSLAMARLTIVVRSAGDSSLRSASMAAFLTSLVASWRACLSGTCVAASMAAPNWPVTSARTPSSTVHSGTSHLGLPASFCSSSWTSMSFLISSCARRSASTTMSSDTCWAPASTIDDGVPGAGDHEVELRLVLGLDEAWG